MKFFHSSSGSFTPGRLLARRALGAQRRAVMAAQPIDLTNTSDEDDPPPKRQRDEEDPHSKRQRGGAWHPAVRAQAAGAQLGRRRLTPKIAAPTSVRPGARGTFTGATRFGTRSGWAHVNDSPHSRALSDDCIHSTRQKKNFEQL